MYAQQFRQAASAAGADRTVLTQQLWAAFAAGHVTEGEAEELSALVMRPAPASPNQVKARPAPRACRPLPREDLERRRRWAAAGRLPPSLASRFTPGETAALAVVAFLVAKHGSCHLSHAEIARMAGVGRSTARNAIREAKRLGVVTVEERRRSRYRSDTNVVRIVSAEWSAWTARRGGGVKTLPPSNIQVQGKGFSGYRGQVKGQRRTGDRCAPPSHTRKIGGD
jgi:hypothetical protein